MSQGKEAVYPSPQPIFFEGKIVFSVTEHALAKSDSQRVLPVRGAGERKSATASSALAPELDLAVCFCSLAK
jgi:hypothetical protein